MQHNPLPAGKHVTSEDFKVFWTTYTTALMARDVDRVLACYADDVVYDESPMMMSQPRVGKGPCRKYWAKVFAAFSSIAITTNSITLHGDHAWVEWSMHNFHASVGKTVAIHGALVLTLRDGRLAHEKLYWDRAKLEHDLGAWGGLARMGIATKVLLTRLGLRRSDATPPANVTAKDVRRGTLTTLSSKDAP